MTEILGAVMLATVCAYVLKGIGARSVGVISAIFFVIILGRAILGVSSALSPILEVVNNSAFDGVVLCALKVIGAGYLFGVVADVCRALSENEIAKAVEVAGRVEIFLLITPFIRDIFSLISGLV